MLDESVTRWRKRKNKIVDRLIVGLEGRIGKKEQRENAETMTLVSIGLHGEKNKPPTVLRKVGAVRVLKMSDSIAYRPIHVSTQKAINVNGRR